MPLAAIYSAPLGRAQQTAAPLAAALDLPVIIEPGIREVELGQLQPALDTAASRADYAEALRARLREVATIARRVGKLGEHPRRGSRLTRCAPV